MDSGGVPRHRRHGVVRVEDGRTVVVGGRTRAAVGRCEAVGGAWARDPKCQAVVEVV